LVGRSGGGGDGDASRLVNSLISEEEASEVAKEEM